LEGGQTSESEFPEILLYLWLANILDIADPAERKRKSQQVAGTYD
jgi:hypothetical protein